MNLTPQSMRSPISPYDQQSKQSFSAQRPRYPATPQPEPTALEQTERGLGIYLPKQQSSVQELPPSPQTSDGWSHSSMMEQDFPHSYQPPDISTAAFDPFSGYTNNANTGMIPSTSAEAPGLVYCQTPPSTNMPSHRSSISSSYSPSTQAPEYYINKVKQEDPNEWYPVSGNEPILHRSFATPGLTHYSTGIPSVNDPSQRFYKPQTAPVYFPAIGEDVRHIGTAPTLPSVSRVKKKRQRTTPEEATHNCDVCGKLFKRSYNWKSHLETHNPDRKYPHPCTHVNGAIQCTKKFQRKTDLDRHVDSVHQKLKNHRCDLCGNRFARRDTLRRHTEDGCTKRFELGFREGTPSKWPITSIAPPMSAPPSSSFPTFVRSAFVSSPVQTGFSC